MRQKKRAKRPHALKALVDTCVWLDLARDYREQPVISALEDLVRHRKVELIVPQLVIEEFVRNKTRIIEQARRGLQAHFRQVCEAVDRFGEGVEKGSTLKALHEIDHKIGVNGEAVNDSVARIERLLRSVPSVATGNDVKQRVTERALAGKAPYHRPKNSVADAIFIEMYVDLLTDAEGSVAFVTHNSSDFSEAGGDRRKPHGDLANLFDPPRSSYWISIVDMIRSVDDELLQGYTFEFNLTQPVRRLSEILEAAHLLDRQVWYNRHWNLRTKIERGEVRVVSEDDYPPAPPYRPDLITDKVWKLAQEGAKRVEKEVGLENLGPWDDFEWGMVNGKLSAVRWMLGDDWDMLDT